MISHTLVTQEKQGGGTAAKKTYSPEELAEVFITSRPDFFGINLAEATNDWSPTIIYSFLYKLREPDNINEAIDWLNIAWEKSHHLNESYELAFDEELNAAHDRFKALLHDIKGKLEERYKSEKREEELFTRMVGGYTQSTQSCNAHTPSNQNTTEMIVHDAGEQTLPEYHMADLPEDVRNCFTFDDDETYSLFVNNMRNDTWLLVKGNKGKYLDRLRFVSNKFGITSKNTTRTEYDKLLHYVIPDLGDIGNLESAMKKQSDTTVTQNYGNYDSPVYEHRYKCKDLIEVGLEIEECLTPVLEKINKKKWNRKNNPR